MAFKQYWPTGHGEVVKSARPEDKRYRVRKVVFRPEVAKDYKITWIFNTLEDKNYNIRNLKFVVSPTKCI